MTKALNDPDYGKKYVQIAERLAKLPQVTRYDNGEHKEAWSLSHAFLDLGDSFKKFNSEYLPQLLRDDLSDEELIDILHDIGMEFQHILYHIHDPKYFSHLAVNPTQK